MKKHPSLTLLLCVGLAVALYHDHTMGQQGSGTSIGPDARWVPSPATMQQVRDSCSALGGAQFSTCFVQVMQQSGASSQALAFARRLDNLGYMRQFRDAGRVDIAYVAYPFRANENYGWLLVNGEPPLVDVDDFKLLRQDELRANTVYAELMKRYPHITIWPGDRFRTIEPAVESSPDGGQRFVIEYRLRDLCHACELVGSARFAFGFDNAGQFLGTRLRGVTAIAQASTDATQPIQVISGQDFTLALESNRTTGYQWQLGRPLDEAMVKFVRSQYREVAAGRPGAGGEEFWTFHAVGRGQTQIAMQYVRPWERHVAPVKQLTFVVVVNE